MSNRKLYEKAISVIQPPPNRHAGEWADQERILPPGSPEPGRWRSSRTPVMIPFLVACSNHKYSTIIFNCGSQMGKTENILNIVGRCLTDGPLVPVLLIFPTEKLSKTMSGDRFSKMIKTTKILNDKLEKGHKDKVMEKFFDGIRCGFAYAGSATELSSHPAGLVVIDEIDRMSDVSGEGDPFILAKARTKNYANSRVVVTSTPTVEGSSRIWALWESGTMGRWSWPCRHCNEYFVPEMDLFKWDKGASPVQASKTAYVVCPHCGGDFHTKHRELANQQGRYEYCIKDEEPGKYINTGPVPPENTTASFWASGLASPWQTFGEIAYIVATAQESGDPGTIQGAINTYLGECYKLRGDAPKWSMVKQQIVDYDVSFLPAAVQLVTMGVDVQQELLYFVIRGYGYRGESWLIMHGEVHGSTEFDQVWIELAEIVRQKYDGFPITRVFIDSGYVPGKKHFVRPDNKIYIFCRLMLGICYPSKGRDMQAKPVQSNKIDVTVSGKTIKGGLVLWMIDTDYFKRQLYSNIRRDPLERFGWHIPKTASEEYMKQITSEECITDDRGKRTWIKTREDNHFLDCEALADAAAYSVGVHNLSEPVPTKNEAQKEQEKSKDSFIKSRQGSFFRR